MTQGAKWAGAPPGAIAASVADMELGTAQVVLDALRAEAAHGGGYPGAEQRRRPLEAAADWWRPRGLLLDPGHALAIGSVTAACAFTLLRTTQPGDGVVRVNPLYPPLVDAIVSTGRRDLAVDLVRDGDGWELDLDRLAAACADATALVWVAPHNPTGRVWSPDEVAAVAELAVAHDLSVVADEVWGDVLLRGSEHVAFQTVAGHVDAALLGRTVTVVGTTKGWNLASAGASVLHAPGDELFASLRGRGHVPLLATPPRTALAAATAAWRHGGDWLAQTLRTVEANVDHAVTMLSEAFGTHRVSRPQGTYLVWLDLRGLAAGDDVMGALAVPDGVVPSDGAEFGAPGFARLNLATTAEEAAMITARVVRLLEDAA